MARKMVDNDGRASFSSVNTSGTPTQVGFEHAEKPPPNIDLLDVFFLEDLYPTAADVFTPCAVDGVRSSDALVVLDTNTLLVPYNIKQDDLTALEGIYRGLFNDKRLFIAARTAREFIKHRDLKLAALLKAIDDQKSRLQVPQKRLSPLLEGVPGHSDLLKSQECLVSARKDYEVNLKLMTDKLRGWRGNDPVTVLYRAIFSSENIIEVDETKQELSAQWNLRIKNRIPPGYKDLNKDDLGIGDFLIWKAILKLGVTREKDLVFVTGEEKADWFVRSNNEGIYPRPEMVDEYRRASGGRSLALLSLSEFLEEMHAQGDLVDEVKSAEVEPQNVFNDTLSKIKYDPNSIRNLRSYMRSMFPGRESSTDRELREFQRDAAFCGLTTMDQIKQALKENTEEAHMREQNQYGEQYFSIVGIARECLHCINPDFDQYMTNSYKNE